GAAIRDGKVDFPAGVGDSLAARAGRHHEVRQELASWIRHAERAAVRGGRQALHNVVADQDVRPREYRRHRAVARADHRWHAAATDAEADATDDGAGLQDLA